MHQKKIHESLENLQDIPFHSHSSKGSLSLSLIFWQTRNTKVVDVSLASILHHNIKPDRGA